MPEWPGGARGALCLSFDNLGVDEATSAAPALPALLERLAAHDLRATFFAEGVNAERDPDALRSIDAAGHEVAYHAWRHESWGELSAAAQTENLARGVSAFEGLGIEMDGLRPPGGQLGEGGTAVLREAGLRYASPAGEGAGVADGIALLPFHWRHVDATCMLPGLGPVRVQMTGSPDPIEPDAFVAYLMNQVDALEEKGGFISIVLHLPLLAWLGDDNLGTLLDKLGSARLWLLRCDEAAAHILADPEKFEDGATLDSTTWAG
ncbi:MAG TPA: polysaccharide deacetylase family protein [Solirubrobacterales bacterium]|nr:polysaccharide deacetylase family protein [Solirubrobacterales bacterium]